MPVMTAADLMALARKNAPGTRTNDPTVKFSAQQRQMRRQAQIKQDRLTPKLESSPKVKPEPMDIDMDDVKPPSGDYTDYTIYSKVIDGETFCLLRFKAPNPNDPVDITHMPGPFRLNRKNPKAKLPEGEDVSAIKEPKWHVLRGPDGREIVGKDGKPVMGATVEGREILQTNWGKEKEKMTKAELEAKKKKAPFKKKTRQVFSANPESRNDPQERFPWVFESAGDRDSWTGRKQNFDDGSAYGILTAIPGRGDAMQFIPVPLRYDFVMTKTHAASKSAEAAEAELADVMKRGSLLYQMNRRANGSASAAALATITAEGPSSSAPGPGSKVKKEEEDDGGDLFGSDDEGGSKRDKGDGGDVDEMDFEEEHADDEDNVEPEEMEDEDTKASKARIKREQIAANKTIDAGVDDEEDSGDETLTREGRRMKRTLKKQGMGYDSDDDEAQNPYASSEEDDDDDDGFLFRPPPAQDPPVVKSKTPPPTSSPSGSRSSTPKPHTLPSGSMPSTVKDKPSKDKSSKDKPSKDKSLGSTLKVPPSVSSRASSPVPGVSGSAVVAQRATSPAPKKGSRSSTPSGNHGGRASSPLAGGSGSRASSPLPVAPSPLSGGGRPAPQGRAQSPASSNLASGSGAGSPLKRKATEDSGSTVSPSTIGSTNANISPNKDHIKKKIKKTEVKPSTSSAAPTDSFPGMIMESEVMAVLREHPEGIVSTALIALFRKRFVDEPRNKKVLSSIVKRVANSEQVKNGNSYLLTAKR